MRDLVLLATTVLLATSGSAQVHSQPTDTNARKILVTGRAVDQSGKPLRTVGTVTGLWERLQTSHALEALQPVT